MIIASLIVIAVYGYIAFEAWNLRRSARPRTRSFDGLGPDIMELEVTPVPPLRQPPIQTMRR